MIDRLFGMAANAAIETVRGLGPDALRDLAVQMLQAGAQSCREQFDPTVQVAIIEAVSERLPESTAARIHRLVQQTPPNPLQTDLRTLARQLPTHASRIRDLTPSNSIEIIETLIALGPVEIAALRQRHYLSPQLTQILEVLYNSDTVERRLDAIFEMNNNLAIALVERGNLTIRHLGYQLEQRVKLAISQLRRAGANARAEALSNQIDIIHRTEALEREAFLSQFATPTTVLPTREIPRCQQEDFMNGVIRPLLEQGRFAEAEQYIREHGVTVRKIPVNTEIREVVGAAYFISFCLRAIYEQFEAEEPLHEELLQAATRMARFAERSEYIAPFVEILLENGLHELAANAAESAGASGALVAFIRNTEPMLNDSNFYDRLFSSEPLELIEEFLSLGEIDYAAQVAIEYSWSVDLNDIGYQFYVTDKLQEIVKKLILSGQFDRARALMAECGVAGHIYLLVAPLAEVGREAEATAIIAATQNPLIRNEALSHLVTFHLEKRNAERALSCFAGIDEDHRSEWRDANTGLPELLTLLEGEGRHDWIVSLYDQCPRITEVGIDNIIIVRALLEVNRPVDAENIGRHPIFQATFSEIIDHYLSKGQYPEALRYAKEHASRSCYLLIHLIKEHVTHQRLALANTAADAIPDDPLRTETKTAITAISPSILQRLLARL